MNNSSIEQLKIKLKQVIKELLKFQSLNLRINHLQKLKNAEKDEVFKKVLVWLIKELQKAESGARSDYDKREKPKDDLFKLVSEKVFEKEDNILEEELGNVEVINGGQAQKYAMDSIFDKKIDEVYSRIDGETYKLTTGANDMPEQTYTLIDDDNPFGIHAEKGEMGEEVYIVHKDNLEEKDNPLDYKVKRI